MKVPSIYDVAIYAAAQNRGRRSGHGGGSGGSNIPGVYGTPGGPELSTLMPAKDVKLMIYVTLNDNDEEVNCDSCLDDFYDAEKKDDLVICDKCNAAVHQSCYGHNLLSHFPQGDWYCERCIALM